MSLARCRSAARGSPAVELPLRQLRGCSLQESGERLARSRRRRRRCRAAEILRVRPLRQVVQGHDLAQSAQEARVRRRAS